MVPTNGTAKFQSWSAERCFILIFETERHDHRLSHLVGNKFDIEWCERISMTTIIYDSFTDPDVFASGPFQTSLGTISVLSHSLTLKTRPDWFACALARGSVISDGEFSH
jgi:hypothetical protein